MRQEQSKPLVIALEAWLRTQRGRVSPKSEIAKAINYSLNRWPAFTRFLDDGRICLSNNAAERAVRGVAKTDSLYTSFSSIWKHWNLVFHFRATRATFSRDRCGDALSLQVGCAYLVRRVRYDLLGGEDSILDGSADRMMGHV